MFHSSSNILLRMNNGDRVDLRITLIEEGRFP